MKKLTALFLLLLQTNAFAGIVSLNTISNDSSATTFNSNFTTIANCLNGQIQGSGTTGSTTNILAASIGDSDLSNGASPRVYANQLLGIGSDTTTSQASFVYTGLTPATSANLTSDVSAGTAYVNGYYVTKSATSETYTASRDTYVDLSQTGAYTLSAVANGAAAPSVAANSARLAKVVTSGTAITSVTDLAQRNLPGVVTPINFRSDMDVKYGGSTTTISVNLGSCEINRSVVTKTTATTLTLTTASDWAGGVSLQATSTMGYVGVDTSGNLKMHTTAPTNSNYALTLTSGQKRYASWSSTTYRIIGWFYMDASGSGQVNSYGVSNIRDMSVRNAIFRTDTTTDTVNDTTYGTDVTGTNLNYYSSGGMTKIDFNAYTVLSSSSQAEEYTYNIDTAAKTIAERRQHSDQASGRPLTTLFMSTDTQATHVVFLTMTVDAGAALVKNKIITFEES